MQLKLSASKLLLQWYCLNKRDLPWRNTSDPYKIWISEIIMQQTRVNQGLAYYLRFLLAFPDVKTLAEANQDDVLKLWQGLGYYSRARNLHAAAWQVINEFGGTFPSNYNELLKLKGVGKYTAAAIASFAFDEKVPLVDGNVYRVISRYFGLEMPIDTSKSYSIYAQKAIELMSDANAGIFNQAIMELGALICSPFSPACTDCPLQENCVANKGRLWDVLPVKQKVKSTRERYFQYLIILYDNKILVKQRSEKDIWQGLFDFPLIETNRQIEVAEFLKMNELADNFNVNEQNLVSVYGQIKHLLTHQTLYISFYRFQLDTYPEKLIHYNMVPIENIHQLAVPIPIARFLKKEFDNFKNII